MPAPHRSAPSSPRVGLLPTDHISPELGGFVRAVFSLHDPDAVAALLKEAGFDDVSSMVSPAAFQLPAPAEFLWQYINLTPMGPIVAQASDAAQSAMQRQVVDLWEPYVVDGAMQVDQPMVIATGRKSSGHSADPGPQ